MGRFYSYSVAQAELLPPDVRQVLGEDHVCFFVHVVVEKLDLRRFVEAYSDEGGQLYHPSLMLKVWLYAYLLGVTSSRRLEQRIREDLAFRYLAAGARPDFWALNEFRRRHARAINDVFVQVLEQAQALGLARVATVAIDSTRIKANASADKIERIRAERARKRRVVRRWQQACDADDPNEGAGMSVGTVTERLQKQGMAAELQTLPRSTVKRSRTDGDARFLRQRGGRYVLGYTGEVAVSADHFIVAARVTQNGHDVHALVPMVDEVERCCRRRPRRVLADSGFYSNDNVATLHQRGMRAYVPDPNLAGEMHGGRAAEITNGHIRASHPELLAMRRKLRRRRGRLIYERRKTIVEGVFGVLKAQRGMQQFRLRGLEKVGTEWMLAALAYNLGRLYATR
jgi:transposase